MRGIKQFRYLTLTGALLATAFTLTPVRAQDPDDLKRGVARISLINGDVNVRRGDSGDWVAGVINAPLTTDDRVATGPGSRTEIQFDAYNALRIGANAEIHLAQLEYGRFQMEMARGTATYRVLRNNDATVEIDTPTVSVRPSRQGSVRITVNDAGETEVTARNGDVEVFTPRGSQWVRSGQTLMARGSASDPEFQVLNAGGLDDWDRWCESRDRTLVQSTSSRYVGQGVYGAEELDSYGNWDSVPEYGYVWHPRVAADWSPYHDGRWSWLDWYGWTWVSNDPWGWAPYHYGRWFRDDRFGWCWYPGLVSARHYWSPALVAFFGFGGGGGFGFGFGNVGWVPLAPYEVYNPWWGRSWYHSGGYFNRQVNITNINIYNDYRNARHNGGVSAVGYQDFSNGRFNHVGRYNGSQIRDVGLIRGATPFTPGNQHLRYSDRNVGNVPRTNDNGRFFRHETPNPAQRVPFNQQVGRASGAVNAAPQQNQNNGFRGQNVPNNDAQGGWRRFGSTSGAPGVQQSQPPSRNDQVAPRQPQDTRGGWQRFGSPSNGGSNVPDQRQQPPSRQQPQQQPPSRNDQVAPRQDGRSGGWQRFGNPGNGSPTPAPRDDNNGRRFGNPGRQDQPQSQPQYQPQAPSRRQDFQSAPRSDYGGRQYNGGGGSYRPPQENIRISPPVVRERPSYSPPPRQSAPSYSPPRQAAPSYNPPARSNGGGGGGGGGSAPRNSGGGGGNPASQGGGGHGRR